MDELALILFSLYEEEGPDPTGDQGDEDDKDGTKG